MKATVKRITRGEYFIVFPVRSHPRGAIGFNLIGGDGQWQLFNYKDTEINCWTSKRSLVEYLEDRNEAQLLALNEA